MNDGTLGGPLSGMALYLAPEGVLPMRPTDGEVARRIVRHGLADVLRWLGEEIGPEPGALVHAIQIGPALYCSRELLIPKPQVEPECTCAMTESSMWTCPAHGEDEWRA